MRELSRRISPLDSGKKMPQANQDSSRVPFDIERHQLAVMPSEVAGRYNSLVGRHRALMGKVAIFGKKVRVSDMPGLDDLQRGLFSLATTGFDIAEVRILDAMDLCLAEGGHFPNTRQALKERPASFSLKTPLDGQTSVMDFIANGRKKEFVTQSLSFFTQVYRQDETGDDSEVKDMDEKDKRIEYSKYAVASGLAFSTPGTDWARLPIRVPVEIRDCVDELVGVAGDFQSNIREILLSGNPDEISKEMEPYISGSLNPHLIHLIGGIDSNLSAVIFYKVLKKRSEDAKTQDRRDFYADLSVAFVDSVRKNYPNEHGLYNSSEVIEGVLDTKAAQRDESYGEVPQPRDFSDYSSDIRSLRRRKIPVEDMSRINTGKFTLPQSAAVFAEFTEPYRINVGFEWAMGGENGQKLHLTLFLDPSCNEMEWSLLDDPNAEDVKHVRDSLVYLAYNVVRNVRDETVPSNADVKDTNGVNVFEIKREEIDGIKAPKRKRKTNRENDEIGNERVVIKETEIRDEIEVSDEERLDSLLGGLRVRDRQRVIRALHEFNNGKGRVVTLRERHGVTHLLRVGKTTVTLCADEADGGQRRFSITDISYTRDIRRNETEKNAAGVWQGNVMQAS